MEKKILKLLAENARITVEDIAVIIDKSVTETKEEIKKLEEQGYIRGYKTVIDWEKTESPYVSAIIELKVTPKEGLGFEEVAEKITRYSEVESVYLMSGVYDLNVVVKCKTLQEVARFVAQELSTIDSVTSTATHFVLRRYKELDVPLMQNTIDERGNCSL